MRGPLRVTLGPLSPCGKGGDPSAECNRGTMRCQVVHGPPETQTFTWEDVSGHLPLSVRGDTSDVLVLEVRHGDTHLLPIWDGGLTFMSLPTVLVCIDDEPADLVITVRNRATSDRLVEIEVGE